MGDEILELPTFSYFVHLTLEEDWAPDSFALTWASKTLLVNNQNNYEPFTTENHMCKLVIFCW